MNEESSPLHSIFPMVKENFEAIPFNKSIGIQLESMNENEVVITLDMKDDVVGNQEHRMLHGGVICSIIDAAGGVMGMVGALSRMNADQVPEEEYQRLKNVGTVNLHVDFLRPGKGKHFVCNAKLLRAGSKVLAIQMELRNESDVLIAVGGGSFFY